MTIPQAFEIAVQHHRANRLAEAESIYRQILAAQPDHADALHLLGLVAHHIGRNDAAADLIHRAILINPMNPAAHCNLGEACRAMCRLDDAMAAYRCALELKPDFPEAHNNLGIVLRLRGQFDEALVAFRRALELKPGYPEAYNNLGLILKDLVKIDEAMAAYSRALQLKPNFPEAHNNLGIALKERGQADKAIAAFRRALELKPNYPEALNNLGIALAEQCERDEAIIAFCRALELKPDYPEAHNNLGNALREGGQLDEAVSACRRALQLRPDYPEAYNNLSAALTERGQLDEAIAACRRALELKPDYAGAFNNLGAALKKQGQVDEAISACRRALELKADYVEAHMNLGVALAGQGELDEAIAAFRYALRIDPELATTHSNLVYALHFHPSHDVRTISIEHQAWNRQFSDPLKRFAQLHPNHPDSERRLRVGYVSPDFRDHPVGRYLLPLFERHDRGRFEILCYSGVLQPDWMTERLRVARAGSSDAGGGWRNTVGVSDARLTGMIREDRVDILVDLALHTAGNRLPAFARQPAPVQVSWLGYPGSTGLPAIGYRLTDASIDPLGEEPASSVEKPVRLPDCWCCYDPAGDSPEVNLLPALSVKSVTFGSLNNSAKANEGVLALWARVLEAVKGSRLVMLCPQGRTRERVRAFFGAHGIATERVELVGMLSRWEYLLRYQQIDIGLDPFPCNGMTTTCDALWMGVPVLTLPGEMPVSRTGLSLLSTIGFGELAVSSEEDYVRMAAELATDLPRLANLRATLRPRMQASPLMDAPRFARNIEAAYRSMWQAWCARKG